MHATPLQPPSLTAVLWASERLRGDGSAGPMIELTELTHTSPRLSRVLSIPCSRIRKSRSDAPHVEKSSMPITGSWLLSFFANTRALTPSRKVFLTVGEQPFLADAAGQ